MSESEAEKSPSAYRISFDLPGLPEGEPVQVAGLGTFENGKSYEVSEEEAHAFRVRNPVTTMVQNDKNEIIGSSAVDGPSLAQAFENSEYVTVEAVGGFQEEPTDIPQPNGSEPVHDTAEVYAANGVDISSQAPGTPVDPDGHDEGDED